MANITLKIVAAEAGVSLATASAALRGENIVKPSTREKVEVAAQKLDYQRNSAAAVLSSHRNRSHQKRAFMVWLSGYPPEGQYENWNESARIAAVEAKKLGLQFESYNIERPEDALRILREIEARGCEGIVWGFSSVRNLPTLPWNRFSVVSTMEDRVREGFDVVCANQFRSTFGLLRRLRGLGYKRIGVCLREHVPPIFDDEARYGAAATFSQFDLPEAERVPIKRIPIDIADPGEELAQWVARYEPDVVVGFNIEEKIRLIEHGYSVPEDLAYVALHVLSEERGVLAGCRFNREIIPEYAVRVLMGKMRHGIRGLSGHPQETVVDAPILAGASCPKLEGDPEG